MFQDWLPVVALQMLRTTPLSLAMEYVLQIHVVNRQLGLVVSVDYSSVHATHPCSVMDT